jgi:hypothetical protein
MSACVGYDRVSACTGSSLFVALLSGTPAGSRGVRRHSGAAFARLSLAGCPGRPVMWTYPAQPRSCGSVSSFYEQPTHAESHAIAPPPRAGCAGAARLCVASPAPPVSRRDRGRDSCCRGRRDHRRHLGGTRPGVTVAGSATPSAPSRPASAGSPAFVPAAHSSLGWRAAAKFDGAESIAKPVGVAWSTAGRSVLDAAGGRRRALRSYRAPQAAGD